MFVKKLLVTSFLLSLCFFISCNSITNSSSDNVSITVTSTQWEKSSAIANGELLINYLVTDSHGSPLANQRVDFEITQGDAGFVVSSSLTSASGKASVEVVKRTEWTTIVKATVFGSKASVTTNVDFHK
jgi:hypothetical protein